MSRKTKFEVGQTVNYWKGIKEGEPTGAGKILDIGRICGSDVAWIEGCAGGIALTHLEPEND